MKNPRDIIIRPIITERTSDLMSNMTYVFEVDRSANKTEIRQAVEEIFKVKVVNVNTAIMPKKPKSYGRYNGFSKEWKKAFVTLSQDSKPLEYFETV